MIAGPLPSMPEIPQAQLDAMDRRHLAEMALPSAILRAAEGSTVDGLAQNAVRLAYRIADLMVAARQNGGAA